MILSELNNEPYAMFLAVLESNAKTSLPGAVGQLVQRSLELNYFYHPDVIDAIVSGDTKKLKESDQITFVRSGYI